MRFWEDWSLPPTTPVREIPSDAIPYWKLKQLHRNLPHQQRLIARSIAGCRQRHTQCQGELLYTIQFLDRLEQPPEKRGRPTR